MKLYVLFFCFFTTTHFCYAQNLIETDTLKLVNYSQKEGIIQLNINGISQSNQGYLWFGTQDGLYRFNGSNFNIKTYNPIDSLTIPDDYITDVKSTKNFLYVATKTKGLFAYEEKTNSFFKIINQPVFRIYKLNKQLLLFAVKNKLIIYNELGKSKKTIVLKRQENDLLVKSVVKLADSKYALATNFGGILFFDIKKLNVTPFFKLDNSDHRSIIKKDNNLYIGTEEGLYKCSLQGKKIKQILKNEIVSKIVVKNKNKLWLATNNGLIEYNTASKRTVKWVFKNQSGNYISKLVVNNIFLDKEGNCFLGTVGEGLWYYNELKNKFLTIKPKIPGYSKSKKISSFQFLPYKDSTLFIGCSHNVLKYNFNNKTFKHYNSFSKAIIWTITKDFEKNIWIGGYKIGLRKYNETVDDFVLEKEIANFFSNKGIINITPFDKNELLISTYRANSFIYNYKTKKLKEFLIANNPLSQSRVSFYDKGKNLWLGTDQKGLYKIQKKEKVLHYHSLTKTNSLKISNNRINGIAEDSKGNIWIATASGLNKYNSFKDTITTYYAQKGFPNDYVYTVQVDSEDKVWVSTNWGISVYNPVTNTFKNYTNEDGLQNNEFNTKASIKDAYGNFYFGGIEGINIFHPRAIPKNNHHPKVFIEQIDLFNTPINKNEQFLDELEFKSHENVLTFHYAALNYLNPEKIKYSYFLEGFDVNWRKPTNKRQTTYTNLDAGTYTFKVKATNDEGIWSKYTDEIKITITPPWYNTPIFKIILTLCVGLLLFLFYWYRAVKAKKEQLKLQKIIALKTTELTVKNNHLDKALNEAEEQKQKILFLMKELQHRTKNNLQIISSLLNIQANQLKSDGAIVALKDAKNRILTISFLEQLLKNDSKMELSFFVRNLSDKILSLLSEQQVKFHVVYNLNCSIFTTINKTTLGLLLNELITNTYKYAFKNKAQENKLIIECKEQDQHLILIVQDNGVGYNIKKIKTTSMGLSLVKEMVKQLKGTINITSNKTGTKNEIIIPLKTKIL